MSSTAPFRIRARSKRLKFAYSLSITSTTDLSSPGKKRDLHPQKLHVDETLNRAPETDAKDAHFGGPSFRLCQNALDILIEAGTDFMNNSNRQLEWQATGYSGLAEYFQVWVRIAITFT